MRKMRNITTFGDNTVKDCNSGKDHDQILRLHGKEIEDDRAIGKIHGKGHFNGKDGSRSAENRRPWSKDTTTYPGKDARCKIERQKSPGTEYPLNFTSKHPKTQHVKYQVPWICSTVQEHVCKELPQP